MRSRYWLYQADVVDSSHGAFDEASVSVISVATMLGVERVLDRPVDRRRFRPNIVVETNVGDPFNEDQCVGQRLVFGDSHDGASVSITLRDQRCMMINLDSDTAEQNPFVMKAVARMNQNNAGAYGTVVREGQLTAGQTVYLVSDSER